MRTSNPALNDRVFEPEAQPGVHAGVMTLEGTVFKTAILVLILLITAAVGWHQIWAGLEGGAASANRLLFLVGAPIAGFIVAVVTIFVPRFSPITAPLYATLQGFFLGAVSAFYENAAYGGIVIEAVGLTVGVLIALLIAYTTRLIQPTERFKLGVVAATGAVCLVYLATMILSFFGVQIPYIHQSGPIGIGFSLVVVVIAALNLVLDFDFIEQGAKRGAPKYMEWYGGFGLLVTLVWLYLEMLRLLSKIRGRS
jgi:uncharacterized YccA/Bax inhibitor family protein